MGETLTLHEEGVSGSTAAITAMKIVDPTTSTDRINTPAAGNRYLAVQFQIKNTGTQAYNDTPDNWLFGLSRATRVEGADVGRP